ncbi:cytochrome P450 [Nocardia aobensis]|uniref:Cytochrome P450 n=1 Tax=Nocardia aobensis TaxID=257277 RepID=A0ABW6PEI0_9NOCA|nr:cytochrome P450 [Nocardia elegans]MBF6451102.1 cytochrome P450 [Nocardia elegans]
METLAESGEYFNPLNPEHIPDPDDLMAASRQGCAVRRASEILYTVHTDAGVRQIFDDTIHFSNRGNFSVGREDVQVPFSVITLADPPDHTALRARLMKDLAPARLRKLAPRIDAIIDERIANLPKSGGIDLYTDYVDLIPARILYSLIGIPKSDWNRVQQWSDVVVAKMPEPTHELPEFASVVEYLGTLVADRRSSPNDRHEDVLDNLCFAEPGEADMPALEVVLHVFQLVLAATDTTRALIANCLFRLLDHRECWEALLADRSLLPNAIEESLRMDSPGQFMVRSVVEDVVVESCPIAAGNKVYLDIQSANHDEQRWGEDSRTYRVDRPNASGHIAFGRGIHACIGAPLARIEARAAIAALLDAYPDMVLAPDATWVKCDGALIRRVQRVPVLLTGAAAR